MNDFNQNTETILALEAMLSNGVPLLAEQAVPMIAELLLKLQELHFAGRFHGRIDGESVRVNPRSRSVSLVDMNDMCEIGGFGASAELCPPELLGDSPWRLPTEIAVAHRLLRHSGQELTPKVIDLYQVGTLLCRLLSGQSVISYLRSLKVKALIAKPLQAVVDQSLSYHPSERYQSYAEFYDALSLAVQKLGFELPSTKIQSTAVALDTGIPASPNPSASYSMTEPIPFKQLGPYRIDGRLGRGGMGDVYLGYDAKLDRQVAIKVLQPELARDVECVHRFEKEATACAQLDHLNVVHINQLDFDQITSQYYYSMEYVKGESLEDLLKRKEKLPIDRVVSIVTQCLQGLGAAHKTGYIHRDVKPSNILLEEGTDNIRVADFGLAKAIGTHGLTLKGSVLGTVDYIAPEQAQGKQNLDERTDLYALGVMMFRMLSGRLPFLGDSNNAIIYQHVHTAPPSLLKIDPTIPEKFVKIVDKLLAKDPRRRFRNCDEVLTALKKNPLEFPPVRPRRDWSLVSSLGGGFAVLLAVSFLFQGPEPDPNKAPRLIAHLPREKNFAPKLPENHLGIFSFQQLLKIPAKVACFVGEDRIVTIDWHKIKLCGFPQGNVLAEYDGGAKDKILALAVSPDGRYMASSQAEQVLLWDFQERKICHTFELSHPVHSLAFSSDSQHLAAGGKKGGVWVWETKRQKEIIQFAKHGNDVVRKVAFTPDGKHVVSGSQTFRWWDFRTGQELLKFGPAGGRMQFAILKDGESFILATSYKYLYLVDRVKSTRLSETDDIFLFVNTVLGHRYLVAGNETGITLNSIEDGHPIISLKIANPELGAEWEPITSPSGRHLAINHSSNKQSVLVMLNGSQEPFVNEIDPDEDYELSSPILNESDSWVVNP